MVTRRTVIKAAGTGTLAGGLTTPAAGAADATGASRPAHADVLVVVEKSGHAVSFYDTTSGQRLRTVPLPDHPHEMVVDTRRRFAYVGHYGVRMSSTVGEGGAAVFVIDLAERSLARTIDTRPFNRVHGMCMDRHDRLYALSEEKAVLLGFDDPATDQGPTRAVPTHGVKTHLFTLSRDGERAYVTGLLSHTVSLVRPHDTSAPPLLATPGQLPESSCLSRDEKTLFVGARKSSSLVALDARTLKIRRRRDVGGDPLRVYTLDDERLLVTDIAGNTLTVWSTDLRRIRSLQLDGTPAAVSLHPTRPLAYVSLLGANRIAVVDLDRLAVLGGFATGLEPDSSALLPAAAT
ncbi:YncE family protein [Streptomyces huasconensis]|uniref:YncE family protein n=1 Tax=Streptomyces huasconensis TaxID=1854574 RepID=UPI001E417B68|nr:YncE family protein [Streptomyces huasconensis]UFQ13648.1 YncE family protein [Streptomyces huasconensis]